MASIHFYHLTSTPLERALPKLLEKSYQGGFRTVVLADNEVQVSRLDTLLWTYDQDSFLPHGIAKDGAEAQPILITASIPEQKVAEKEILFITNGITPENTEIYDRVIDMFDGSDTESLTAARARWKQYKDSGAELFYYQQTASGSWEKKA